MDPLDRFAHDILQRRRPALHLSLRPGQCWSGPVDAGQELHSKDTALWVTLSGLPQDVVLQPGQRWRAPHAGRAVAQGLAA
jgi:hypothetical protein